MKLFLLKLVAWVLMKNHRSSFDQINKIMPSFCKLQFSIASAASHRVPTHIAAFVRRGFNPCKPPL